MVRLFCWTERNRPAAAEGGRDRYCSCRIGDSVWLEVTQCEEARGSTSDHQFLMVRSGSSGRKEGPGPRRSRAAEPWIDELWVSTVSHLHDIDGHEDRVGAASHID